MGLPFRPAFSVTGETFLYSPPECFFRVYRLKQPYTKWDMCRRAEMPLADNCTCA